MGTDLSKVSKGRQSTRGRCCSRNSNRNYQNSNFVDDGCQQNGVYFNKYK
jgi:hypothetical protein